MIYLTRKIEFSAAHYYYNPTLSAEENQRLFGKCNHPHGHNYVLEVTVAGEPDTKTGMVLNLDQLKQVMQREVMDVFDHKFINHEVPALAGQIPTCENIAIAIWNLLQGKIPAGRLHRIRLYETPDLFVEYFGGEPRPSTRSEFRP